VVPPNLITHVIHFVPTNISLSYNVEITVRTTNVTPDTLSHERLERELRLVSVERGFQPVPRASLSTFTSLLSSVNALYGSPVTLYYLQKLNDVKAGKISGFTRQVQASKSCVSSASICLTAYPASERGTAKDQLRGRREFLYKADVCCCLLSFRKGGNQGSCHTMHKRVCLFHCNPVHLSNGGQ